MRARRGKDEQHGDANEFKKYAESEERRQRVLPFVIFGITDFDLEVWITTIVITGLREDFDIKTVETMRGMKRTEIGAGDMMTHWLRAGARHRNDLATGRDGRLREQFVMISAHVVVEVIGPGVNKEIRFEIDFEFGRLHAARSEANRHIKRNERAGVHPGIGGNVKYEAEKEKEESGAGRAAKGHARLDSAPGRNVPPERRMRGGGF